VDNKDIDKLKLIVYAIVIVAILGAFLNIPFSLTNTIIQWLIGAFVGSVCSLVAGSLVEAFTGDWLKKIALNINIYGFKFSITIFAIATFIVKVWLFGL
jgi:hypothetical protein